MDTAIQLGLILLLIVFNGLFAMAEIAVISARRARLEKSAREGNAGASAALELARAPDDFLATVQVGITAVGILAGALSGATVAGSLAGFLARIPWLATYAAPLALAIVVCGLTYLSLVLGELVPKRIALAGPERIASAVSRPMKALARAASPAVRFLSASTDAVIRLLGVRKEEGPIVTEEELRALIDLGTQAGTIERAEQTMIENILRLGDRPIGAIMTPRPEIVYLDRNSPTAEIARILKENHHSRYPVVDGDLERAIGVVRTQEILARSLSGGELDVVAAMKEPLFLPESTPALKVLERFKEARPHLALVVDEYGGVEGLVTITDVLQAIVGELPAAGTAAEPRVVRREDGSWLLDGTLDMGELATLLPATTPAPGGPPVPCHTLAGLVMWQLGRMPRTGDRFEWHGIRFEVIDMDGRRVDKVLATETS